MTSKTSIQLPIWTLNLRMDDNLKRKIKEAADQNRRSMNSEILRRLERSFDSYRR